MSRPTCSIKCRTETGKSKFITADIRKAIRKRNALKRKFNKTRKSQDWGSYRVMRNRVVAMRRKSIVQHFDKPRAIGQAHCNTVYVRK